MGKVKQANGKAAKESKSVTSVKNAGVTKASDTPKAKSKQMAKDVALKAMNGKAKDSKKSKKKVESSSESESESESEEDSDDSESDSDASEAESAGASSDDSDSESSGSESEEEKKPVAKTNGKAASKPTTNGKAKKEVAAESSDSSDSSDEEEDSDDSDSSDEEEGVKAGTKVTKAAAKKTAAESSDDDDDDDDSSDSSDSSDDDDDSAEEKKAEPAKKRKAEEEVSTPFKKTKTNDEAGDDYVTLFVGNLGWGVDDNILYDAFKDCEGLSNARVVTDKQMQRSRGFGYVDFESHEAAKAAYEKMNEVELEGRNMRLDPSKPRPAGEDTPNARANDRANKFGDQVSAESDTLFVGNLPFEATEDIVSAFFSEAAEVKSLRLPTDMETGNPKGFGYVTFNSVEDAKTAFNSLNGGYIGEGRGSRAVRLDFASQRPPRDNQGGGFGGRGGGRGGGGFGGRGGGGRGGGGFGGRGGGRGGGGFGGRGGGGRGGGRGGFGGGRGGKSFEGKKTTF